MKKTFLPLLFALPLLLGCQRGYKLDSKRAGNSLDLMISSFGTRVNQVFHSGGYTVENGSQSVSVEYSTRGLYLHKTTLINDADAVEETLEVAEENAVQSRTESWVYIDALYLYELSYSQVGDEEPVATGTKTAVTSASPARSLINPEANEFQKKVLGELELAKEVVAAAPDGDIDLYSAKEGDMSGTIGPEDLYVRYDFSASLPVTVSYVEGEEEIEKTTYHYGYYTRNIPSLTDFEITEDS